MSNKPFNSRVPRTVTFDRFGGIRQEKDNGRASAASVVNFRIREDGALEKRCGARCIFDFPSKIRAFWSGYLYDRFATYFLVGNTIYYANINEETQFVFDEIASSQGSAHFFYLQRTLYLADGNGRIYRFNKNNVVEAVGYVPLLGKDWDNDNMGEIYEPYNLLNNHVRITYVVSYPPSIFLRVPKVISSVEAVYLNGTLLPSTRYSLNREFNTIDIAELAANDRVEVFLTFEGARSPLLTQFSATKGSVFFGSGEKSRTFFFGNPSSDTVFCSQYVASESLERACLHYDADPLYLPENYEFQISDGSYPIRGALRHHDNLLFFTDKETWRGNEDSIGLSEVPVFPVNSEIGCITDDGCVLAPNDPITISHYGICRWHSQDPEVTNRDATRISQALDPFLDTEDLQHCGLFYDHLRDELWVNNKSRDEIWIASLERGDWFCFTDIHADRIFYAGSRIAWIDGAKVCVMEPDIFVDMDEAGNSSAIKASYQTTVLDFESDKMKNLSAISLDCTLDGGTLRAELCEDERRNTRWEFSDAARHEHATLTKRLRSGRFQNATLRLTSSDNARTTLYSLTLTAH